MNYIRTKTILLLLIILSLSVILATPQLALAGDGEWTWMSGADTIDQAGVYGNRGMPSPANVPGARWGSISWIDNAGNLWLMGGAGHDSTGNLGHLNDLWRYDSNEQWTWISGANVVNQAGSYYIQGKPLSTNVPGARYHSISWIDNTGNLWLLGGYGRANSSISASGRLNDLWRYDTDGQWIWMSGADTLEQTGVYGTQGIPDPANVPGARRSSISWADNVGNLWLLGGSGRDSIGNLVGELNDLWRYDNTNEVWAWMSGANTLRQAGIYGHQGIPAPTNVPGARRDSISWVDNAGNLWLWGGRGYGSGDSFGYLNDLWRYDITTKMWTWMSGADTANQSGIYGSQGIPDSANVPGARIRSISWIDGTGRVWLLGGLGYDSAGNSGHLNDLWRYDTNGEWTWMSGANIIDQAGVYGNQGTPNPANVPGARDQSISWIDSAGNLWLLGGYGYDSGNNLGSLNDLWRYELPIQAGFNASPIIGPWPLTVVFTNTSTGDYTTSLWDFGDGITSTLTHPTHMYTTIGTYTVTLTISGPGGILTETKPSYIVVRLPIPVQATFSASPTIGPRPLTVVFTNTSTGDYATSLWDFGDGITSSLTHPTHKYIADGIYTVTLTIYGQGGTDTEIKPNYIGINPIPVQAAFSADPTNGPLPLKVVFTNISAGDYATSLWDFGDGVTSTLTHPTHTYATTGTYTVTLIVSGLGGADTEIKPSHIVVRSPIPVQAGFNASSTNGVRPLTVVFTNTSTGDYTTSLWDFGDGITSTLTSPIHMYTATGTYTVTLTINGPGGTATEIKLNYIVVNPIPVQAAFSASPTTGPRPLTVVFTNISTGDYATSLWDFGDGVTSTLTHPTHTYATIGIYTVNLTISGPGGTDTETRANHISVWEERRIYLPLIVRYHP